MLLHGGAYEGAYLERFLTGVLGDLGVRTFGDLRSRCPTCRRGRDGPWSSPVSDLSRRRLVRLPWDLAEYGLDPDGSRSPGRSARAPRSRTCSGRSGSPPRAAPPPGSTAGCCRASPWACSTAPTASSPRWPTFGLRLSRPPQSPPVLRPVGGPVDAGARGPGRAATDQDEAYAGEPCTTARTVVVPTGDVSVVDFDLTREAVAGSTQRAGRGAALPRRLGLPGYVGRADASPELPGATPCPLRD